jgi:hypothetical protein
MPAMNDSGCCGDIASFVSQLPGFEVMPHIVRLIANGEPVGTQEVAGLASQPAGAVERMPRDQPGTDWDEDGRLAGFVLTLRPTPHRFGRVLTVGEAFEQSRRDITTLGWLPPQAVTA